MTLSDQIALTLLSLAVLWPIAVGAFYVMYKLPTRSLLQQVTRPSAREENEDLAQMTDDVQKCLGKTMRLWPVALLLFLTSIVLFAVR